MLLRINTAPLNHVMLQYCRHTIVQLLSVNNLLLFLKLSDARWRRTVVAVEGSHTLYHLFKVPRNPPPNQLSVMHQP